MLSRTADHLFWMARYVERADHRVSDGGGRSCARRACDAATRRRVVSRDSAARWVSERVPERSY
jgi:uncharacterized alpha-E superfamily protein